ncbi:MAG: hypothetical protein QXW79_01030 [Thermoplasmata archaeon]
MFSSIKEAWDHDPVKEISSKLSKGIFQNRDRYSEIFNLENKNSKEFGSRISDTSENRSPIHSDFSLSLSDVDEKYASVNLSSRLSSDNFLLGGKNGQFNDAFCTYVARHLKLCENCNNRLRKMISDKLRRKKDEIMLENLVKQLQEVTRIHFVKGRKWELWRDMVMVVGGFIFIVLILLLIFKCSR